MKFAIAFVGIALAFAQTMAPFYNPEELGAYFKQFKSAYSRSYATVSEEIKRKEIFIKNLDFILHHNAKTRQGQHSYYLGVNNFTDLKTAEFTRTLNGYRGSKVKSKAALIHDNEQTQNLPKSVDWTSKGIVTPVKNQYQCASCWAFSSTGSIEGQRALKTGKLVSLSEQNLVDCSKDDDGCNGGWMDYAFEYVIQNHGLDTEDSYPYTGVSSNACKFNRSTIGATLSSYADIKHGSELALQNAVATIGPITVAIDAASASFQMYKSGIYNEPACSTTSLDHAVLVVGYGTLNGTPYWKVKNSWGTDWGQNGYILMSRNKHNQCGIATNASYPIV